MYSLREKYRVFVNLDTSLFKPGPQLLREEVVLMFRGVGCAFLHAVLRQNVSVFDALCSFWPGASWIRPELPPARLAFWRLGRCRRRRYRGSRNSRRFGLGRRRGDKLSYHLYGMRIGRMNPIASDSPALLGCRVVVGRGSVSVHCPARGRRFVRRLLYRSRIGVALEVQGCKMVLALGCPLATTLVHSPDGRPLSFARSDRLVRNGLRSRWFDYLRRRHLDGRFDRGRVGRRHVGLRRHEAWYHWRRR